MLDIALKNRGIRGLEKICELETYVFNMGFVRNIQDRMAGD